MVTGHSALLCSYIAELYRRIRATVAADQKMHHITSQAINKTEREMSASNTFWEGPQNHNMLWLPFHTRKGCRSW